MSGPNLNLDYDPLEGPSTRIWKPKEEPDSCKFETMKIFMNKFMDNVSAWASTAKDAAAVSAVKEPIPTTDSERDGVENEEPAMKMKREKMETFQMLARELGHRMGPEQRVACGLMLDMAMKNGIFSSSKVDDEKLDKLQSLARELGANMPRSQRFVFSAMCNMAMERFREQAARREEKEQLPVEKEKAQLPVGKEECEFELD